MTQERIVSIQTYIVVFVALLVLLGLTYALAFVDLGPLNVIVALSIAVLKALLIVLYFMHVRHGSRLTWVFAGAGVFWLLIMFALTMGDFLTRGPNIIAGGM